MKPYFSENKSCNLASQGIASSFKNCLIFVLENKTKKSSFFAVQSSGDKWNMLWTLYSHMGLEQHEDEWMMPEILFLGELFNDESLIDTD